MPKILIVGTEEFEFPIVGENAGYGEQITDWATAVTDALTTVQQPNDLLPTTANIANNITVFTNIPGFSFNTSEVIAINAECIIQRSLTSPATVLAENTTISGNFDGTNWTISVSGEGDSGVEFDITPAGQIQYKSSNLVGSGYLGSIIFKAKVFNQDT